jgi:hypothetical protein
MGASVVVGFVLRALPELVVFLTDERMELIAKARGECSDFDETLHVREILKSVRRRHPRGQLQLDERGYGNDSEASSNLACS